MIALQHPLAGGRQRRRPSCSPSWPQIDNVVAVKQANDDELGPIEGLAVLAGNDDIFLRTLEFGGAGGILVASHIVGAADARDVGRGAGRRPRARARDRRRAARRSTRRSSVTTNPIPVKAALEMLGLIPTGPAAAAAGPADDEQRRGHPRGARGRRPAGRRRQLESGD